MRLSLILLFIVVVQFASVANSYASKRILILGDSLSAAYGISKEQSWVTLLDKKLKKINLDYQIINASITGSTTANGLTRLPKLLATHNPDLVMLELGGNDGLRGLSLKNMKKNLQQMIDLSQDAGAEVFMIGIKIPLNYGPMYTLMFDRVYSQLQSKYKLPLVPFLLDGVATNPALMQSDRIHPNAKAQAIILDNVWIVLKQVLL